MPTESERMAQALKYLSLQKKYREVYGKHWRQIYEEDKQNNNLMKDE